MCDVIVRRTIVASRRPLVIIAVRARRHNSIDGEYLALIISFGLTVIIAVLWPKSDLPIRRFVPPAAWRVCRRTDVHIGRMSCSAIDAVIDIRSWHGVALRFGRTSAGNRELRLHHFRFLFSCESHEIKKKSVVKSIMRYHMQWQSHAKAIGMNSFRAPSANAKRSRIHGDCPMIMTIKDKHLHKLRFAHEHRCRSWHRWIAVSEFLLR